MTTTYLAFDLGRRAGGRFSESSIRQAELREIQRFPNTPVHENDSLRWDIRGLWTEMQRGLALAPKGFRASAWTRGRDFALLAQAASCSKIRITIGIDARTE